MLSGFGSGGAVLDTTERPLTPDEREKMVMVVVPTYNEAENLPNLLSALYGLGISNLHVLIVDDNSPDGTGDLVEKLAQHGRIIIGFIGCMIFHFKTGRKS